MSKKKKKKRIYISKVFPIDRAAARIFVFRTSQLARTTPDIDIAVATSGDCTNYKREARKLSEQIKQAKKPRARCKRSLGDDNEAPRR